MNNVSVIRDRIWILLIAGFSAVLFFYLLNIDYTIIHVISPDTYTYIEASELLYNHFLPHPTRPIGYAFLSGLPRIFIPSLSKDQYLYFAVFLNFTAWIGSLVYVHKTLLLFLNRRAAFLISLISVFLPGVLASVFFMLTESVVLFFITWITFYLFRYDTDKNINHLIIAVTAINLLVLIRPGFIYPAIVSSVLIIFYFFVKGVGNLSRYIISFILVSFALIILQISMMYRTYGDVTSSYIDKFTWYNYLGARSYASVNKISEDSVMYTRMKFCSGLSYPEISRISTDDFKLQLSGSLQHVSRGWLMNLLENSSTGSNLLSDIRKGKSYFSASIAQILHVVSRYQNLLFTIVLLISVLGWTIYWFSGHWTLGALIVLLLYIILSSGISFLQGDRFHSVLYPSILIVFVKLIYASSIRHKSSADL